MSKHFYYKIIISITLILLILSSHSFAESETQTTPVDLPHNELGFDLYSPHILLMEANSGKVLYEYHAKDTIYPASTTKIMTAILTLEHCNLQDTATVSYNAIHSIPATYQMSNIQEGEVLTIEQLLHVLLIPSANDAAVVLAEHIAGSVDKFAEMMNQKALEIGCKNTHFVNPNGIHADNHTTTTYDMALIGRYAMQNPTFRAIVTKKQYTLPTTNKYDKLDRTFRTTNDLIREGSTYYYPYCIGGKTGFTNPAQSCIVTSAAKDNQEYIISIMGASRNEESLKSRELDCKNLFNYAFEHYRSTVLVNENDIVTNVSISSATKETKSLDLYARDTISAIVDAKSAGTLPTPEITLRDDLHAPFSEGEVVGIATYQIDGASYQTELLASHTVYRIDYIKILLYILILIFLLMVITAIRENHRKNKKNSSKSYKKKGNHQKRWKFPLHAIKY